MSNETSTVDQYRTILEGTVYVTLSTINVIHSVFSIYLLLVFGPRAVHHLVRRLLITLSVFETLFHACVIIVYSLSLAGASGHTSLLTTTVFFCLRFGLTMRNWSVAIIAMSRIEPILCPLASMQRRRLSDRRIVAIFVAVGALACVLCALKQLAEEPWRTALHNRTAVLRAGSADRRVMENIYFVYQGALPTALIATSAALIAYRLKGLIQKNRQSVVYGANSNDGSAGGRGWACVRFSKRRRCHNSGATTAAPFRRTLSVRRREEESAALVLIVALALTFSVFELPTGICVFVQSTNFHTDLAVNILVELDSLANFVIYIGLTRLFRDFISSVSAHVRKRATSSITRV